MTIRRRAVALCASALLATGGLLAGGAEAADTGPDNVVWVKTTGTDQTDAQSRVRLGSYAGDNLQSTNVARAESTDCTDCRTVAVAVQAVFVTGHPTTAEPKNVALAINDHCLRCTTYAFAYQYVVTTDGPVRFSHGGRARISALRREIRSAARSDLPPDELNTRLKGLASDF